MPEIAATGVAMMAWGRRDSEAGTHGTGRGGERAPESGLRAGEGEALRFTALAARGASLHQSMSECLKDT